MRDEKVRGKFDEKELKEFIDNTPISIHQMVLFTEQIKKD